MKSPISLFLAVLTVQLFCITLAAVLREPAAVRVERQAADPASDEHLSPEEIPSPEEAEDQEKREPSSEEEPNSIQTEEISEIEESENQDDFRPARRPIIPEESVRFDGVPTDVE